ncbi:class I SAM-dependent methyltransferase [Sporosalibacterium faouarense]|uniref:class I SAM-dependent methyltransferase n=1 Tax=Sporosalibacterium faouarense TaxID=516123 RepID=UPI00141D4349|nr:methyltransferase domain-containing protein [Sporosalibacterium faouarense]MTI49280.1 methyltransferase domain-containing protein [Bacillota bacterium]
MGKKFKPKNMKKLDNPLRRKVLPPEEVINRIGIKEGVDIADIGCGIGYFTIPMAKSIAENNKVYAIDISKEMIDETDRRLEEEEIKNVETILSNENNFKIPDNSTDIVFTSTVFHELDDPKKFLNESKRILRDQGRLIILDWNKVEEEMGPPIQIRKEVDKVKDSLKQVGIDVEKIDYIGNSFYIIHSSKINK